MNKTATLFSAACLALSVLPLSAQTLKLSISSNAEELRPALRAASLIFAFKQQGNENPQDYVAAARADYRRLLTGLYAAGYYGGAVSIRIDGREAQDIDPLASPETITQIDITVEPGPRFSFGQTVVTPVPPETELPEDFATGRAARSDTIRQAVRAGVDAWREVGHAKAAASDQQITAYHTESRLDVAVQLAPGPRLSFGKLQVSGNQAVRTDRINEIAGLPRGQVFSPEEVERSEARLRRTGAFSSVKLSEAEAIGPGDTLDIIAQVAEEKPRRIGYGIEYSTVEGLTLSSYWMHRNLLGGAERLRVDGKVAGLGGETGGIDYALAANFLRPATFHVDTDLYVRAGIEHLDEPDYVLDQLETEVGLTRIIGNELTLSGGVGFTIARTRAPLFDFDYSILTLPFTAELDRRDDILDASSGYYANIEATPFAALSGADSGLRLYADGRIYRSFGETRRVTLAARGQIGSVIGPGLTEAPTDFLFYSGGGDTVRGQNYQSLGVFNGTYDQGGLSLATLSTEARVSVTDTIDAVGFYDIGYVGANAMPLTDGDWHSGAGVGVRYKTGIGPIRFDVATPANGPEAGESISFYIGIGQSF